MGQKHAAMILYGKRVIATAYNYGLFLANLNHGIGYEVLYALVELM
jgi:hypothetical protein